MTKTAFTPRTSFEVRTKTSVSTRIGFTTLVITLTATALPSFTQTDFQSSTNAAGMATPLVDGKLVAALLAAVL